MFLPRQSRDILQERKYILRYTVRRNQLVQTRYTQAELSVVMEPPAPATVNLINALSVGKRPTYFCNVSPLEHGWVSTTVLDRRLGHHALRHSHVTSDHRGQRYTLPHRSQSRRLSLGQERTLTNDPVPGQAQVAELVDGPTCGTLDARTVP
jgi:hypothetical protein